MTENLTALLLAFAGALTGFVDSIAGGGGLISLPSLALALGPGPVAVGTNKIVGAMAALTAVIIYAWHGHLPLRRGLAFSFAVMAGAYGGSLISPSIPPTAFKWVMIAICPLILLLVTQKRLWLARATQIDGSAGDRAAGASLTAILLSGLACGLYDGAWGPGAGTFMTLALLFIARRPLLEALATAKLANSFSAMTALASFYRQGYVQWLPGLLLGFGALAGALVGSNLAVRGADRVVRPVLVVVTLLLIVRLFQ